MKGYRISPEKPRKSKDDLKKSYTQNHNVVKHGAPSIRLHPQCDGCPGVHHQGRSIAELLRDPEPYRCPGSISSQDGNGSKSMIPCLTIIYYIYTCYIYTLYTYTHTCINVCVYIQVHMYIYIYPSYLSLCAYIYIYIYIYNMYMHACMHSCIYTYLPT